MHSTTTPDTTPLKASLLPLADHLLLVPSLVIVEVIGAHHKLTPQPDAPQWLLGTTEWKGKQVPVVDFELGCQLPHTDKISNRRLVIINAISGDTRIKFFALRLYGIPSGIELSASLLHEIPNTPHNWTLSQVRIGNIQAIIPNLVALEKAIITSGFKAQVLD